VLTYYYTLILNNVIAGYILSSRIFPVSVKYGFYWLYLMAPKPNQTPQSVGSGIFYTECEDFKIEWNSANCIYLQDSGSTFNFKVTPASAASKNATDFCFHLSTVETDEYKDCPVRAIRILRPCEFSANYRPNDKADGVNQVIDVLFSYSKNGRKYCYWFQIHIEIVKKDETPGKILNKTIINVKSLANDNCPVNIFNDLMTKGSNASAVLAQIKNSGEIWLPMGLLESPPLYNNETYVPSDNIGNKSIYPASYRALLEGSNGKITFLVNKDSLTMGKNKQRGNPENDVILRVLPCVSESETPDNWDKTLMIGKSHLTLNYDSSTDILSIRDNGSKNGVFFVSDYRREGRGKNDTITGHKTKSEFKKRSSVTGRDSEDEIKFSKKDELKAPGPSLHPLKWKKLNGKDHWRFSIGTAVLWLDISINRNKQGKISSVFVNRVSNYTTHEYVMLIESIDITYERRGSDYPAAQIINKNGEFVLKPYESGADVCAGGRWLNAGEEQNLSDNTEILIGKNKYTFFFAEDKDFTEV